MNLDLEYNGTVLCNSSFLLLLFPFLFSLVLSILIPFFSLISIILGGGFDIPAPLARELPRNSA